MQFSQDDINGLRKLWLAKFGEELNNERALREARRLLMLINFTIRAGPYEKVDGPPVQDSKNKLIS